MDFRVARSWIFQMGLILAMLLFMVFPSSGVQIEQEWSRTFGGHYGDGVWSVQAAKDGGYILAGYTSSRGEGSDLWLIKTDSEGHEIWNKTFGGSGEDVGTYVAATKDGGYIVVGSTKSYGMGEERLWLLKTDSNGSLQWDRTFGGFVSSSGDGGWSACETSDGYIMTGYTKSSGSGGKDLWLIKTDADGNMVWDRTYGGPKDDVGISVIQAGDGYVLAGRTASFGSGGDDIWLLRVGPDGRELWNTTFGGNHDDAAFQVMAQPDGYVVVGRTESDSVKSAILIKTNLLGRKLWERVYEDGSAGISLHQASDGGFIIGGHIESRGSGSDGLLIKTGPNGAEEWALRLGGPGDDTGTAVVDSRGDFLLAGITSSAGAGAEDAWLVKVSEHSNEKDKAPDLQNATTEKNASNVNIHARKPLSDSADQAFNESGSDLFASDSAPFRVPDNLTEGSGEDQSPIGSSSQKLMDIENIFKQRRRA
jgi:hypothetical protein